jgi:hypothetical protein
LNISSGKSGNLRGIEPCEGAPVVLALVEDGFPRQSRLRALEDQELEEHPVVVHRHAPFRVVVGDAERRLRPGAALDHQISKTGTDHVTRLFEHCAA